MKPKVFKKLRLGKKTIANLNSDEMRFILEDFILGVSLPLSKVIGIPYSF